MKILAGLFGTASSHAISCKSSLGFLTQRRRFCFLELILASLSPRILDCNVISAFEAQLLVLKSWILELTITSLMSAGIRIILRHGIITFL